MNFTGACSCIHMLPVALASWTLQKRPGSPPWLRLLSAWWPGYTGFLGPMLQPEHIHRERAIVLSSLAHLRDVEAQRWCCWGVHTSFRILKDSFMAFFTLPSPFTWSSSIRSLKCCNKWTAYNSSFSFGNKMNLSQSKNEQIHYNHTRQMGLSELSYTQTSGCCYDNCRWAKNFGEFGMWII